MCSEVAFIHADCTAKIVGYWFLIWGNCRCSSLEYFLLGTLTSVLAIWYCPPMVIRVVAANVMCNKCSMLIGNSRQFDSPVYPFSKDNTQSCNFVAPANFPRKFPLCLSFSSLYQRQIGLILESTDAFYLIQTLHLFCVQRVSLVSNPTKTYSSL